MPAPIRSVTSCTTTSRQPSIDRQLNRIVERAKQLLIKTIRLTSYLLERDRVIAQIMRINAEAAGFSMAYFPTLPPQLILNAYENESLDQLEVKYDRFISYQMEWDRVFEQMLRLNAEAVGVVLVNYPYLPAQPVFNNYADDLLEFIEKLMTKLEQFLAYHDERGRVFEQMIQIVAEAMA
ncbi:hypothetical protein ACFE04_009989 [Oxalis oulophora]